MSFREFLEETTIYTRPQSSGTSLVKVFTPDETKKIIKALKKHSGISDIVRSMENDEDYSLDVIVKLNDGTSFTLYAHSGILRMGAGNGKTSKAYEVKAVTVDELVRELPTALIQ